MFINFRIHWEYDGANNLHRYKITNENPKILFYMTLDTDENVVILDVKETLRLMDLESLLNSIWEKRPEITYPLIKTGVMPLKSFKDEETNIIIYATAHYVQLTEESMRNLQEGYLIVNDTTYNLYLEKAPEKTPIREYTKRSTKVEAIQYKLHNIREVDNFVNNSSFNNNGTLFVTIGEEKVEVLYGDYVVKDDGRLSCHKPEDFKEMYY